MKTENGLNFLTRIEKIGGGRQNEKYMDDEEREVWRIKQKNTENKSAWFETWPKVLHK